MQVTNFDIRVTKKQAELILLNGINDKMNFDVMCKEYGDDDEWVGLTMDDLGEDLFLDNDYQTIELWLNNPSDKEVVAKRLETLTD